MTLENTAHFGWGLRINEKWNLSPFLVLFISCFNGSNFVFGQTSLSTQVIVASDTKLSDEDWAKGVFRNFLSPLNEEEISILKKQLNLTNEQENQIVNLCEIYKTQQKLWKEVEADESGKYTTPEKIIRDTKEESEKNYSECLNQVKQLRYSLGVKDGDFLKWVDDELFLKISLGEIGSKLKNPSPEDVASAFIKESNLNKDNKTQRTSDQKWWFEKRALFLAFPSNGAIGKKGKQRKSELNKKRQEIFQEMMSR